MVKSSLIWNGHHVNVRSSVLYELKHPVEQLRYTCNVSLTRIATFIYSEHSAHIICLLRSFLLS